MLTGATDKSYSNQPPQPPQQQQQQQQQQRHRHDSSCVEADAITCDGGSQAVPRRASPERWRPRNEPIPADTGTGKRVASDQNIDRMHKKDANSSARPLLLPLPPPPPQAMMQAMARLSS